MSKKRKVSNEYAKRVARIVCSRYAMDKLCSMADVEAIEQEIARNIRTLSNLMVPVRKGGKRATVQFKDDIERMSELKKQQKRVKVAKSKRGNKRDNPTEKQARLRDDWPLFEQ